MINKNKKLDNFQMKDNESQIYGFRNSTSGGDSQIVYDPILQASEKTKQDLDNKFKRFQQNKIDVEAHSIISMYIKI